MDINEIDINRIVKDIKQCKSDEEKFAAIEALPEEIRIKILEHYEYIYKQASSRSGSGRFQIITMNNGIPLLFKHLRNLQPQVRLEFLKGLSDKHKEQYFTQYEEEDWVLEELIKGAKNFGYKLYFTGMISDDELRVQKLKELDVKKSFLYYTEGIGNKGEIYADNINVVNNQKYNMIGLPKELTFGIEIECFNKDYAKYLMEKGKLFLDPNEQKKQWICKIEPTAGYYNVSPNTGLECVSGILNDSEESTKEIYEVCDFLNDLDFNTDDKCGGHIHFGRDYLETPQQLWNVIELYGCCEDVMNLILNKPNSLPRNGLNRYAGSAYKMLLEKGFDPKNFDTIEDAYENITSYKMKDLDVNVSWLTNSTIEFRAPNGSLDPNVWIENIKLLGSLMVASKGLETGNLANIDKKRELFNAIKSEKDISKKCSMLLDILFDDEREKDIYRERFDKNIALQYGINDFEKLHSDIERNKELGDKNGR